MFYNLPSEKIKQVFSNPHLSTLFLPQTSGCVYERFSFQAEIGDIYQFCAFFLSSPRWISANHSHHWHLHITKSDTSIQYWLNPHLLTQLSGHTPRVLSLETQPTVQYCWHIEVAVPYTDLLKFRFWKHPLPKNKDWPTLSVMRCKLQLMSLKIIKSLRRICLKLSLYGSGQRETSLSRRTSDL